MFAVESAASTFVPRGWRKGCHQLVGARSGPSGGGGERRPSTGGGGGRAPVVRWSSVGCRHDPCVCPLRRDRKRGSRPRQSCSREARRRKERTHPELVQPTAPSWWCWLKLEAGGLMKWWRSSGIWRRHSPGGASLEAQSGARLALRLLVSCGASFRSVAPGPSGAKRPSSAQRLSVCWARACRVTQAQHAPVLEWLSAVSPFFSLSQKIGGRVHECFVLTAFAGAWLEQRIQVRQPPSFAVIQSNLVVPMWLVGVVPVSGAQPS